MSATHTREGLSSVERILERAIEVIEAGGEVAIRTNVIAKECGVTPPILYRAFESREGLVIAAQAERYRRTMADIVADVVAAFTAATTKEQFVAAARGILEYAMSPRRVDSRRLRMDVMGSAVSRPALAAKIVDADREAVGKIVASMLPAREAGWIEESVDLTALIYWVFGMTNGRLAIEFDPVSHVGDAWTQMSVRAVLDALFGHTGSWNTK